ncbi:hypothetical protein PVAP13_9KG584400 [Panicum virgatum]|uniref:CYRIA/CYRIB Rac1 binding domain-containing protein n=1 Tax=Panicum virgatum TaxID=38727 RepID=A0A8T0P3Q3_PANVG|nr:hypothetical protein PVAP13_9KG584400 [Panicum virgatum]
MAIPVEEAIAALSTFSLEDEQPDVQGLAVLLSSERYATNSPIEYSDVAAYRLSLGEDTKAINQLNTLIQEGKEMASLLYTYRSCVKALPQLPDSMKHSQADLYLETYQVLDLEMSRLREIQRWQASAASKLAADMQRFSRPERLVNGPTITHFWSMLKLLDVLLQLDHLKNAKASIPNDFSWYKRTFTQVSSQWQDTETMREELDDLQIFLSTRWAILLNLHAEMFRTNTVEDILQVLIVFCVESLELDFALLYPERHTLLRVLPVLVVLATSSEKESESLYKRVKINRLLSIFKNDPVIPAFPDLHLSPAAILKELSSYFQNFSSQTRLLSLPAPHEIPPRELQDYQRHYLILNHMGTIRAEHDDFSIRFASAMNQMITLKSSDSADNDWSRDIKGNMYDIVVEGFQLLSRWTGRIWEQCAWKFSRPCKEPPISDSQQNTTTFFDYEKVVRWNYTAEERRALLELIGYIKSIGLMMQHCDTLVSEALWETIHMEVQDFVQDKLDTMLRTTFRKKKDLSRILSDMRTLSADWMANTSKADPEQHSLHQETEEMRQNTFYPRPVAPTAAQVDLCFDLLAQKLNEIIFTYYKSCAASTLLDSSFTYACDDGEKYFVKPLRFDAIFKLRRVMVLGRTIDLRSLITQRMNKIFRENIDFLLERFENGDLCGVVELQQLLDILELTHQSISRFLELDSYSLMLSEMQENLSLVSYSSRISSQIWSEMQTDFLPNFILCNTTQRFVRSIKGTHHSSQRSSASTGKPYFYCGSHDLTMAYQGLAGLYRDFFGVPHMFAVVKLLGSRSLPAIIRALLDHISSKITGMVPKITALQEALPKSIGLLSFDGGIAGCQKIIHEILTWEAKSEVKTEVLHDLKEIGSALYWMSILDIVLRQIDTTQFMQSAPWLGLVPGNDGQVKHAYSDSTPFTTLLSAATNAVTASPACPNPSTFLVMSKQAEAASLLYKSNLNSGSVLEYALAFTSAALDRHYSKWSATPRTGFIDITTSKDFYRIFSGLQYSYLEESINNPSKKQEMLGDSVAWAGCTIMYLLGQQQHFELFDFSYQFLNVAEVESATVSHYQSSERTKSPNFLQGYEGILEAMRKARRLNNHVFSMLRARCPLEDKVACAIKPSGAPLHRMKFMNTVSAFETLPQRAT